VGAKVETRDAVGDNEKGMGNEYPVPSDSVLGSETAVLCQNWSQTGLGLGLGLVALVLVLVLIL